MSKTMRSLSGMATPILKPVHVGDDVDRVIAKYVKDDCTYGLRPYL